MPYVQRDNANVIIGDYAQPQYDTHEADDPVETWVPIATEWVDDDNSDLLAYRASQIVPEQEPAVTQDATQKLVTFLNANPDVKKLLGL